MSTTSATAPSASVAAIVNKANGKPEKAKVKAPKDKAGKAVPKDTGKAKDNGKSNRYSLMDHPVTAVNRWMGKQGWTWHEARAGLEQLQVNRAEGTDQIPVNRGARGGEGEPASLSKEDQAKLKSLLAKARCEKNPGAVPGLNETWGRRCY